MQSLAGLPSIVIVGRPNVGKSTLFNAILGSRRSIVGDEPGITRDRIHGEVTYHGKRFELIDTGGILPNDPDLIPSEIFKQARFALASAEHIIFVVDGRTELTASDRDLARHLRSLGKPVALAVNKMDVEKREVLAHEFHTLGFANLFPISAEHRRGLEDLLDHVTAGLPSATELEAGTRPSAIRVAIIGRPNAGKSTLLNTLCGAERAIVSPVAGTTRDAVDESVTRDGVTYTFVDTAGIRRKGKTKLMAEKLSVVMARKHIGLADVVLFLIDATEGVVNLDANIAGYAIEEGRPVIIVVNKWDAAENQTKKDFTQKVRDEFKFLEYAPVIFLSAKTGGGVTKLFPLIRKCYESASHRVGTGELNRFVELIKDETDVKILYMTQASIRPPTFVCFTDQTKLHFSTERFLVNQLRKRFGFDGTPVFLKAKSRHAQKR